MTTTAARFAARARRGFRVVTDAVCSVVAPAALVRRTAPSEVVPDPAGLFTPDEMPTADEIEAAAVLYTGAVDQARTADRAKRKARKMLDRLPAGWYEGRWLIERVPSARQTPDLESIRATYAALGLGDVPMRSCAPSLKVTALVTEAPAPADEEHGAVLVAA